MGVIRSILATLLFIALVEISSLWALLLPDDVLADMLESPGIYNLINGFSELFFVVLLLYLISGKKAIIPAVTEGRYYALGIIGGIAFIFLQSPLKSLYTLITGVEVGINYDFDLIQTFQPASIAIILFYPIAEELFFRGYIQRKLQEDYSGLFAIVFSALLFACIHLPFITFFHPDLEFNPHQAYITFFGGLISAVLYQKSGSLGPSIVMHMFWNFMVLIV